MEKGSPKSPALCEKYKSGCAWCLIGLCDFSQGHSNKKLISNRERLNSHAVDDRDIKNTFHSPSNSHEKCQYMDDGVNKTTLTKDSATEDIMEGEEMATEQQRKKKISTSREKHVSSDSQLVGHLAKNHRRKASKTFHIHGCKDISTVVHTQPSCENSVGTSSKWINAAALTETSCNQVHPKSGKDCSNRNIGCQKNYQLSEINLQVPMNEAVEAFINQKFIKGNYLGKDRASHRSKHFLDALEILNSNKELFIKLLHDPDSLLVKHIQDLRDYQAKEQETRSFSDTKLSKTCRRSTRECVEPAHTPKSCDRYLSKASVDPQTSNRIVVLKSGTSGSTCKQNGAGEIIDCSSPQALYSLRHRAQSGKPAYFSFEHMKRKLRHALGLSRKEKPLSSTVTLHKSSRDIQGLGDGGKGNNLEIVGRNSPCKISLGIGEVEESSLDDKRRDKVGEVKDFESGNRQQVSLNSGSGHENLKLPIVRHLKQHESNIFIESKKHLSEVFRNRNEVLLGTQFSETLGRIISMPEHYFLSARSRGRHPEYGSVAGQMRFCPYSNYQMINEKRKMLQGEKKNNFLSPLRQIIEAPSWADNKIITDQSQIFDTKTTLSHNHFSDSKMNETVSSENYPSRPTGPVKIVGTNSTIEVEEVGSLGMPLEPNDPNDTVANKSTGIANTMEENPYLECLELDLPVEKYTPASPEEVYNSSLLSIRSLEDSDGLKDKAEQPNLVSVLEKFVEDITSPSSIVPQPAEVVVEPKKINYAHYPAAVTMPPMDLKVNSSNVMNKHESISKYMRAVLEASGINWDKLSMKCHSSDQLLEPSLFDEVEVLPNQSCCDHRLLFNYINEVLGEIHQSYFSCSPWLSFAKQKIQPFQAAKNMVYEVVMKCVDWQLLSQQSSLTLEQLIEKDLAKSVTWMDIRMDTEDTVREMVENLLEELTLETAIQLRI